MELHDQKWYHFLVKEKKGSLMSVIPRENLRDRLVTCLSYSRDGDDEERLFTAFSNYMTFYKYQFKFKEDDRAFFEVILGEFNQKDHFDIELTTKDVDAKDLDDVGHTVMTQLLSAIINEYEKSGIILDLTKDLLVFSSHGATKRSFHVVVDNYCRPGAKECKLFYDLVIPRIEEKFRKFIDPKVYNSIQQFRLMGSQKRQSKRPKKMLPTWKFGHLEGSIINVADKESKIYGYLLFEHSLVSHTANCTLLSSLAKEDHSKTSKKLDHHDYEDLPKQAIDAVLDVIAAKGGIKKTDHLFPYEFNSVQGRLILLRRKRPSFCTTCRRVHENENPFVTVADTGEVFFNCRRCEKSSSIGFILNKLFLTGKAKEEKVDEEEKVIDLSKRKPRSVAKKTPSYVDLLTGIPPIEKDRLKPTEDVTETKIVKETKIFK